MNIAECIAKPNGIEGVTSSDGESEAGATGRAHASRLASECATAIHDLNNAISVILLNAQVMEWKLPPYSHAKRHAREIERNAQRSAELLKQLIRKLPETEGSESVCGEQLAVAVTAQEPNSGLAKAAIFRGSRDTAPVFQGSRRRISHTGL